MHEARAAFRRIKGRKNQYGEENEAVLVQEYMKVRGVAWRGVASVCVHAFRACVDG